jgi:hypothetical protein
MANYSEFLLKELLIRYPTMVFEFAVLSLEERRGRLAEEAQVEAQVERIRLALKRKESVEDIALIIVEQAMPCLLHCENRVNEHVFYILLQQGFMRYGDGSAVRRQAFIDSVLVTMRTEVLGTDGNPSQWRFPFSDETNKMVKKENLTNPRSRQYIEGIEAVIKTIYSPQNDEQDDGSCRLDNESQKAKWLSLARIYKDLILDARQEEDFTDEEIDDFHDQCNLFMTAWMEVSVSTAKVTNYIHMLGAGHFVYYLRHFRNLYKYSNQGWEALNQKIKRVYFNNTNRGGNIGGWQKIKDGHCDPIWKYLARSTLWKTGDGRKYFTNK